MIRNQSIGFMWEKAVREAPQEDCIQWARTHCVQTRRGDAAENPGTQLLDDEAGVDDEVITPMLVFVRKVIVDAGSGQMRRRYFATTIDSFEHMFRACSDSQRHFDEIIVDGPCKLYLDLEIKPTEELLTKYKCADAAALWAMAERSSAALIDQIVGYHRREHQATVEAIRTTAHKATKWSMHVTFDGDAVWRNRDHCRHYVLGVIAKQRLRDPLLQDLVDRGVYSRNRAMRTYRSSKHDEPTRVLLAVGERITDRPSMEFMRRALITCVKAYMPMPEKRDECADDDVDVGQQTATAAAATSDAGRRVVYLSTMFMHKHVTNAEALGVKIISAPGFTANKLLQGAALGAVQGRTRYFDIASADELAHEANVATLAGDEDVPVAAADEDGTSVQRAAPQRFTLAIERRLASYFSQYEPYCFKIDPMSGVVLVACKSKRCALLAADHTYNHTFFLVDLFRQTWCQRCHNEKCKVVLANARPQWQQLPAELADECRKCTEQWSMKETLPALAGWCGVRRAAPTDP